MNKDLTVGKPISVLWKFCIPLFLSIIFQQLYNLADSLVAGNFISENAFAAVGNGYEVTLIFIAFAFGCNIGCSVMVSRFFGGKDISNMKTTVSTTLIASGVLCLILMILGLVFCKQLLLLINTPEEILEDSMLYLNIYIYSLPFVFYYNVATGIFSALGDSKTPFIFLACSSLANIGMDILFVKTFSMGVSGVAWATFICQGVSCVLSLIVVFIRLNKFKEKHQLFSFDILKKIAIIAIPSILQQSFISVGNIIIQGAVNSFGSSVTAGYSAAVKLNNLVVTSLTTLGNGVSNYTSQNLGAKKIERVKEGFKAGLIIVFSLCVPFVLLYTLCGGPLIDIFIRNPSIEATETGKQFLYIVSPFYLIVCIKFLSDSILRGSGLMKEFMIDTFVDLILRVGLALILSKSLQTIGIWLSWPIGWVVATILSFLFYKKGYSKKTC